MTQDGIKKIRCYLASKKGSDNDYLKMRRVTNFRSLFCFVLKQNEAKQKPFSFLLASFRQSKNKLFDSFRFVLTHGFGFVSLHFS